LLDEYIPVIEGTSLNEDPLNPITQEGRDRVAEMGDKTPVSWLHRDFRYTEKLATPDVSVADLIGDVDPIKAANLKLNYNDERVIHFGLVPNAHRGIFVINELPDLQPRIQVALFNILQEGDIQIRGFKVRLPLDVGFVFTANPEDYTNRGSIITPLKDRIQSQIITHYPREIELSEAITKQESKLVPDQESKVEVHPLVHRLVEQVAFEARESDYIDQKSGVSARMSITAYELLIASAERRMILSGDSRTSVRLNDLPSIIPAVTGKVELVYEGEQEGAKSVAMNLIGKAIRTIFPLYFPNPELIKRQKRDSPYAGLVAWFSGDELDLSNDLNDADFTETLFSVSGLTEVVNRFHPDESDTTKQVLAELLLHGLAEYSQLNKAVLEGHITFKDIMRSMFNFGEDESDSTFE
jgi:magnesium chelatase subunit I